MNDILGKSLTHPKNQPLTVGVLLDALIALTREVPKARSNKVFMSSDEEGNEALHLYAIDITESGQLILWPAHDPHKEINFPEK